MQCAIPESELPALTPAGRRVLAGWYYRSGSPVRQLHRRAKFKGCVRSALLMGRMLGKQLDKAWGAGSFDLAESPDLPCLPTVVHGMPSHAARIMDRGIQPTRWIAQGLSERLGLTASRLNRIDLIERSHLAVAQDRLSGTERQTNVGHVFRARLSSPHHVILVDDLITTGATLDAGASVLESAGHRVTPVCFALRRELF